MFFSWVVVFKLSKKVHFLRFCADFYYFIKNANVQDFADDNTLASFVQNVRILISVLESESNIDIDWFETNNMIVNTGKTQSIVINKKKRDHTKETFEICDKIIEASPSAKLLGVQIDDKLNFNLHITNTCRSAENQLNALIRSSDSQVLNLTMY